ncbi:unnamed protein product [Calicophoron daubneyi]|uniref:Uncharacterized protein n=1 Tax=Calicophoron daubneyi TaxID=300641 RepID=A0AAV2TEU3_CALDB
MMKLGILLVLWTLLSAVDVDAKLPNVCCIACWPLVQEWRACWHHSEPIACKYVNTILITSCLRQKCNDIELAIALEERKIGIHQLIEESINNSYNNHGPGYDSEI